MFYYVIAEGFGDKQVLSSSIITFSTVSDITFSLPKGGKTTAALPADIISALSGMGQKMVPVAEALSTVQGIMKINDNIEAYSDWRKYGQAATF